MASCPHVAFAATHFVNFNFGQKKKGIPHFSPNFFVYGIMQLILLIMNFGKLPPKPLTGLILIMPIMLS